MGFMVVSAFRQVVYISQATGTLTESELNELVEVSRRNNKKYGITGALLYLENAFIQAIEGEDAAISELLGKLTADARHRNIRIISDNLAQVRNFQNWSMGIVKAVEVDRPEVLEELRLASPTNGGSEDRSNIMPVSPTFMMMRRLYDTSNVLQRAQGHSSY
ncbi:MAG: BLUF domain-containing protein [Halioglobus sp.]